MYSGCTPSAGSKIASKVVLTKSMIGLAERKFCTMRRTWPPKIRCFTSSYIAVVAHEVARPDQQIVEARLAGLLAPVFVLADEVLQPGDEARGRGGLHCVGGALERLDDAFQ